MIKHARAGISKPFYAQGSNTAVHGQLPYIITRIQQLIIIKQSQSSFSQVPKNLKLINFRCPSNGI